MTSALKKVSVSVSTTAAAFLMAAAPVFAQNPQAALGDIQPGRGFATTIGGVFSAVLTFVMVLAALAVLTYLIWGGFEWITSGGDKGKTESARNKITAAVIGIVILAAAYAIFLLILNFVGFSDPSDLFGSMVSIDEGQNVRLQQGLNQ